jgi:putative ATP-dependent endonuclease of the OLD family
LDEYQFIVKTGFKSKLETDLTITEDEISIENKGKGRQCFIKTEFALQKTQSRNNLDTLLLEEPENHLSHINMKKLVRDIAGSEEKQLFIATHNNLISSRLDLRKTIMLNSNSDIPILLKDLPEETAKFFIKAPDNNILEYILSSKVILVEGDAEFILIEALYKNLTGEKLEDSNIHVISVGGTSFKRYLDLAKLLNIKTAIIRDNDKDAQTNCVDNYTEYIHEKIGIFYESDNTKYTFEVCMYELNKIPCDALFLQRRKTLTVEEYMLKNKADVAFELLDKKSDILITPQYIREAIEWIKE